MDLNCLKSFCTVVEAGSISKAAKKLFMTQPALSVKIRELENQYQTKLLERSNIGVKPTETGLLVYKQGQKVLSLSDNIQREIEKTKSIYQELSIGAANTIGNFALPCTLYIFKERNPNFNIKLSISNSEEVAEKILLQKVEMGLIEGPLSSEFKQSLSQEGIKTKKIAKSELILVVRNNKKWQDIDTISVKDFIKLPLIIRESGSGIRSTILKTLSDNEITINELNIILELNTINAITSTVAANKGVSLLPKMALRKELRHKILKAVKIEGLTFEHDFTLLYRPIKTNTELNKTFLNFLNSSERGFC